MKTLLMLIALLQRRLIENFSVKKHADSLSQVAGLTLEGNLPSRRYKEIFSNLKSFKDDWKRFKEDSGKVVVEKNLFIRLLKEIARSSFNSYFIFSDIDDDGSTTVDLSPDIKKQLEIIRFNDTGLCVFISLIIGFLLSVALLVPVGDFINKPLSPEDWWVTLPIIFSVIVSCVLLFRRPVIVKRAKQKLGSKMHNFMKVINIYSPVSCAYGMGELVKLNLPVIPYHEIDRSPFLIWLAATLKEMVVLQGELNERRGNKKKYNLGWLWCDKGPSYDHRFSFTFDWMLKEDKQRDNYYFKKYYDINIDNIESGNLLPVIETDSSFIFFSAT